MDMSLSKLWEMVMEQGKLTCCSPWDCEELDMTEQLNWAELITGIQPLKIVNHFIMHL